VTAGVRMVSSNHAHPAHRQHAGVEDRALALAKRFKEDPENEYFTDGIARRAARWRCGMVRVDGTARRKMVTSVAPAAPILRAPFLQSTAGYGSDAQPCRYGAGRCLQAATSAGVATVQAGRGPLHRVPRCLRGAVRAHLRPLAPRRARSPTSFSSVAFSITASRACAARSARTHTCWPSRASAATSVPVATPSGSRSGRSGLKKRSSRRPSEKPNQEITKCERRDLRVVHSRPFASQ
jgi:hypothetical protein